jgi:hypothetical protein
MSRHWKEHKYTSAENLWCWIDEISGGLDLKLTEETSKTGEFYKAFLAGQKELLEKLCDYLHENQITLGDIVETFQIDTSEAGEE